MTKRKKLGLPAWQCCIAALGAALVVPRQADAQNRIQDDVGRGPAQCISGSSGVPGLWGLPRWPITTGGVPDTANGDWTLRDRSEITDPRWGNAAMTSALFGGLNTPPDMFNYRILQNATTPGELEVSIQVKDDLNGLDSRDYVLFGVAAGDGSRAWAFRYEPAVSVAVGSEIQFVKGNHIKQPSNSRFKHYEYDNSTTPGTKWNVAGSGGDGRPTWVSADYVAGWNLDDTNATAQGARWAVQFRITLPSGLNANTARYFIGVRKSWGLADGTVTDVSAATANIFSGCGTTANPNLVCTVHPAPEQTETNGLNLEAAFPFEPADWSTLSALTTGACANRVNITQDGLFSLYPGGKKDTVYVDPSPSLANPVTNRWQVNLDRALVNGNVVADLFIANWGTAVAEGSGSWTAVQRNVANVGATLSFSCNNATGTALNICGVVGESQILGRTDMHQCMQAQLRKAQPTTSVNFTNPSVWSNMYYDHFSEVNQLAEISVKGLQAKLRNSNARDVYFHVVRRNMPYPGVASFSKNTSQLNALRAQIDPSFSLPAAQGCSTRGSICIPQGTQSGICAVPAGIGEGYFCTNNATPQPYDGGYWCATAGDVCVPQAGGGYNTQKTSLTPAAKLRAEFINYEVYPYVDTGRRRTKNGVTTKVMLQMPSFGTYFTHDGAVFGFLQGIMEEYGSPTSPSTRPVKVVGPDLYMITIPNEQNARLKIHSQTQDTPAETFSQVVGTATPVGFLLGNATFTGLARTRPLDLRNGTVTISRLLNENGRELVSGLSGPITLTRDAGALRGAATFSRVGFPTITMQVFTLPLIGQAVAIQVSLADVAQPASCPLLLGLTRLKTTFTINDGGSPVVVDGSDDWLCVPGQLLSF
jgi:hypothetical protein